jgi:membrane-bound lytic murein transglycosylase D
MSNADHRWNRLVLMMLAALMITAAACPPLRAAEDPFPVFPSIEPNVEFWKKIYSQYSTRHGVIHDSRRLDIIYDVVYLEDPDLPGGRKINHKRVEGFKKKYQQILQNLAHGISATTPEERRVVELFGPDATPSDFSQAVHHIRCQVGQKDRFRNGVIRSGAYLDHIIEIFREHGLPEDLAYLPHVESSYNTAAYSKFGAAGMWQFTRSTGKQYMTVGYAIDERRDPIISTHAAARLLMHNYQLLQDWPLALTAYNHGTAGMLKAQRKMGSYEAIFKDYRSRIFKFASRNFYSEFLAAREVAKRYREHFGDIRLHEPQPASEVRLAGYTHLPTLARHLEIDMLALRRLNPALREPVFDGIKYVPAGYTLRLPADEERDWHSLIAEASPDLFHTDQKRSRFHTVQPGETAGEIARVNRIPLQDLVAANDLNSRATIYVGQTLLIPSEDEPLKAASPALRPAETVVVAALTPAAQMPADEQPTESEDAASPPAAAEETEAPREITERLPGEEKAAAPEPESVTAEEETGAEAAVLMAEASDPPATIAEETEAPQEEPDQLPGDETGAATEPQSESAVPVEQTGTGAAMLMAETSALKAASPASHADNDPGALTGDFSVEQVLSGTGRPVGVIRVEPEETLGHYAEWLKVSAHELRRLNGMRYGQPIRLGQKLKIPLHRVNREAFEEQRFEYHKELVEDFFAAYRVAQVQLYSIRRGDNIWSLSKDRFELPLWLIRRYNSGVDLNTLMPSQTLRIPVVEREA